MRPEIHINSKMLTNEHLMAYLKHELSPEDMHKVETIVEHDEFYKDALEGLKLASAAAAAKRISRINTDIEIATGVKKPGRIINISPVRAFSIAVAIIVFIAVGVIFMVQFQQMHKQDSGIALNDQTVLKPADQNRETTPLENKNLQTTVTENNAGENRDGITAAKEEKNEGSISQSADTDDVNEDRKSIASTNVDSVKSFGAVTKDISPVVAEKTESDKSAPALAEESVVSEKIVQKDAETKRSDGFFNKKKSGEKNQDNGFSVETPSTVTTGSYAGNIATDEEVKLATDSTNTFKVVEVMPEYPGGAIAMNKFITDNFHYLKEDDTAGKIFVQIKVNKNGFVMDPKIIRGINTALDNEALRVVSIMPPWKPGMNKGIPVDVTYIIEVPINSVDK